MGRVNKTTEGVFVNIIGNNSVRPAYNVFLSQEFTEGDQDGTYCLADLINQYSTKCTEIKVDLEQLAQLEILIMQIRTRYNFKDTIKLYYVKKKSGINYIYARCPFYRTWSDTNEVRVLIEKVDDPTDAALTMLSGNPEFMQKVYDEVIQVMDGEIEETLKSYKKIYQK